MSFSRTGAPVALALVFGACAPVPRASPPGGRYLPAVREFAENVLRYGHDVYGPKHTPLFIDGIHVDTREPPVWRVTAEFAETNRMPREWIPSNLASQQVLFRVLVALTDLTGDPRYRRAAEEAIRYAFGHLQEENGLLYWGGHAMYDALHDEPVGEWRRDGKAGKHELKDHHPFYGLMWDVDPAATRRFLDAFWDRHIFQWDILDMNRHGAYAGPAPMSVWDREYTGGPVPFIGKGLTFLNTGMDLMVAGAFLYEKTGDPRPLAWAKRLGSRYDEVRHPVTGLGSDNYSEETTRRFVQQFGPEFGERITEATLTSIYSIRYGPAAVCRMKLAEHLGPAGAEFREWALADLRAFARHAYDPEDNGWWVTIRDGTKLGPEDVRRPGYMSPDQFRKRQAGPTQFWAFALAYRLTGDPEMWEMARRIGRAMGLGDLGPDASHPAAPDLKTSQASDHAVFGLLELHARTKHVAYLDLALRIGDNLLARHFHRGLFLEGPDHLYAKFDQLTPLTLLTLDAAASPRKTRIPEYTASHSFFHCEHETKGRTYDSAVWYSRRR